jgi:hypothetical protein
MLLYTSIACLVWFTLTFERSEVRHLLFDSHINSAGIITITLTGRAVVGLAGRGCESCELTMKGKEGNAKQPGLLQEHFV